MTANITHIAQGFVDAVAAGQQLADVSLHAFRDRESFSVRSLHNHVQAWEDITAIAPYEQSELALAWIRNKVDVFAFFRSFKGQYKGQSYDSVIPPSVVFQNSVSCKPYTLFITHMMLSRLALGAISIWGKVGEVDPP